MVTHSLAVSYFSFSYVKRAISNFFYFFHFINLFFPQQVTDLDDRVVGDIFVDYSASEGLHRVYVKCKDEFGVETNLQIFITHELNRQHHNFECSLENKKLEQKATNS